MRTTLNPTEAFVEWALSWSGMHGGNPAAPVWICGIEPGLIEAPDFSLEPTWEGTRMDGGLDAPAFTDAFHKEHRKVITTWPTIRKLAKLGELIEPDWGTRKGDEGWRKYLERRLFRPDGATFHLNLYPIPFLAQRADWSPDHVEDTGLPNKLAYRAWCVAHRFAWLRELAEKHRPKVIVATGRNCLEDFLIAFGNGDVDLAVERELDAPQASGRDRNYFRAPALDGQTTLFVTPQLGGRGGLGQEAHLRALSKLVRERMV